MNLRLEVALAAVFDPVQQARIGSRRTELQSADDTQEAEIVEAYGADRIPPTQTSLRLLERSEGRSSGRSSSCAGEQHVAVRQAKQVMAHIALDLLECLSSEPLVLFGCSDILAPVAFGKESRNTGLVVSEHRIHRDEPTARPQDTCRFAEQIARCVVTKVVENTFGDADVERLGVQTDRADRTDDELAQLSVTLTG